MHAGDGVRGQRRRRWRRRCAPSTCWCCCCSAIATRRCFAGLLHRADAAAAHLVGDRRRRAVGSLALRRGAARARRISVAIASTPRRSSRRPCAAAYAVQFRPESLLILPVVGAAAVAAAAATSCARPRLWWVGLLCFVLRRRARRPPVRGPERGVGHRRGAASRSSTCAANLRVNGWFYLVRRALSRRRSRCSPLLGLLGRGVPARARCDGASTSCCSSAIDLLFYAGSYNYGADVRYSLMTYPPLAVLGGLGAARLVAAGSSARPGVPGARLAVTAGLGVPVPLVRAARPRDDRGSVGGAGRRAVCADRSSPSCRGNSYVLTHNPGMFHLWGVNAGQMSLVVDEPGYARAIWRRATGRRLPALELLVQRPGSRAAGVLPEGARDEACRDWCASIGSATSASRSTACRCPPICLTCFANTCR